MFRFGSLYLIPQIVINTKDICMYQTRSYVFALQIICLHLHSMMLQALNCLIENPHLLLINLMAIFLDIIKDFLDIAPMKYQKNPTFPSIPPTEPETVEASMPRVQDLLKPILARVVPAEMPTTLLTLVEVLPRVKISPLLAVVQLVRAIIPRAVPDVKMGTPRVDLTWIQVTLTEQVLITPRVAAILARVEEIFNLTAFRQITPLVNLEMVGT